MLMPEILAFLIPMDETVAVLPLTQKYKIKVEEGPDGPGFNILKLQSTPKESAPTGDLPIDSITVVYGENGDGKTRLLLNICHVLGRHKKERPLGVLWEADSQVFLDPGSFLKHMEYSGDVSLTTRQLPMLADRLYYGDDRRPSFAPAFYTTSPFEANRRRSLNASATLDVTPEFVTENQFSGAAFLQSAGALPSSKDVPFVATAGVRLRIKVQSLEWVLREYMSDPVDRPSKASSFQLPSGQREFLRRLHNRLDPKVSARLAIEIQRTKHRDAVEARELVSRIVDAANATDLNTAIRDLVDSRRRLDVVHSIDMERVLRSLAGGLLETETRRLLPDIVDTARRWDRPTLAVLQEAEILGFLKWSFIDLSSGQVAFLMLFASLARAFEEASERGEENIVLLVDEGEMFMHPKWQRRYLSDLMKFLKPYKERFRKIHLILSTHSLIVAGDAPPFRLFDAKSGEIGNAYAAGPTELLDKIYHVKKFAGEMAESLNLRISKFLREGGSKREEQIVRELINHIASEHLKGYFIEELNRRTAGRKEGQNAQA